MSTSVKKKSLFFCFLLGLLLLALFGDENVTEAERYQIEFEIISPHSYIDIDEFQIYYDFLTNEGNLSFEVAKSNNLREIKFTFPQFSLKTFEWTNKSSSSDTEYVLYSEGLDDGNAHYSSSENVGKNIMVTYHGEHHANKTKINC